MLRYIHELRREEAKMQTMASRSPIQLEASRNLLGSHGKGVVGSTLDIAMSRGIIGLPRYMVVEKSAIDLIVENDHGSVCASEFKPR